ncbi:MAG: DUF1801 domain-containing protein [Chitinivibrionales bacterium]|nr:DUF1801 domain-containing protein [Chitinivibrionales bacterium]
MTEAQKQTDLQIPATDPIECYISRFPPDVRSILEAIRTTIRNAAPEATEAIAYQMPTFVLQGNLVHFAAYSRHIGFYPTPSAIVAFKVDLTPFATSKGAIQFPLDKPIPHDLISKIVRFRVEENQHKAQNRSRTKPLSKAAEPRKRSKPKN